MLGERSRSLLKHGLWLAGAGLGVVSFLPLAWKVRWGLHGPQHWRVHVATFTLLGLMAFLSVTNLRDRVVRWLALIVIALAIETLQTVLFGDRLEWSDVAADVTGAISAMAITQLLEWRNR
jgi:hypothetical protein